MLCQSCKKNEAAVFLKVAVNNKVTEMHLCEACAAAGGAAFGGLETGPMNISGMMGNMSGYFKEFLPREKRALHCRTCGLTYHEFKESGFLGCPECYADFAPQLTELLTRIHGNCLHAGKRPALFPGRPKCGAGPAALESGIAEKMGADRAGLKEALKKAVEGEDFEAAARLRDRIRNLEGR